MFLEVGSVGPKGWPPQAPCLTSEAALDAGLAQLRALADALAADIQVVHRTAPEAKASKASKAKEPGACTAAVMVRRRAGPNGVSPLELRVAVIGNVDSGKSTMVGVLTRNCLDDGRGAALFAVLDAASVCDVGRVSLAHTATRVRVENRWRLTSHRAPLGTPLQIAPVVPSPRAIPRALHHLPVHRRCRPLLSSCSDAANRWEAMATLSTWTGTAASCQ